MMEAAYCGLKCEDCPVFIATVTDNTELRIETAEAWSGLYSEYTGKDRLTSDDMNCMGCRSDGCHFIGCTNCVIRQCCIDKNNKACALCAEFETCGMIQGFLSLPENNKALDNTEKIRDGGSSSH